MNQYSTTPRNFKRTNPPQAQVPAASRNLPPDQPTARDRDASAGLPNPYFAPRPNTVPQTQPPRRALAVVLAPSEECLAGFHGGGRLEDFVREGHRLSWESSGQAGPCPALSGPELSGLSSAFLGCALSAYSGIYSWSWPGWWRSAELAYSRLFPSVPWAGGVPEEFGWEKSALYGVEFRMTDTSGGLWEARLESVDGAGWPAYRPVDSGIPSDGSAVEPDSGEPPPAVESSDDDGPDSTGPDFPDSTETDSSDSSSSSDSLPGGYYWRPVGGMKTWPWPGAGAVSLVPGPVVEADLPAVVGACLGRSGVTSAGRILEPSEFSGESSWSVLSSGDFGSSGSLLLECDGRCRYRATWFLPELSAGVDGPEECSVELRHSEHWNSWYGVPEWLPWRQSVTLWQNRAPGRVGEIRAEER